MQYIKMDDLIGKMLTLLRHCYVNCLDSWFLIFLSSDVFYACLLMCFMLVLLCVLCLSYYVFYACLIMCFMLVFWCVLYLSYYVTLRLSWMTIYRHINNRCLNKNSYITTFNFKLRFEKKWQYQIFNNLQKLRPLNSLWHVNKFINNYVRCASLTLIF